MSVNALRTTVDELNCRKLSNDDDSLCNAVLLIKPAVCLNPLVHGWHNWLKATLGRAETAADFEVKVRQIILKAMTCGKRISETAVVFNSAQP